MGVLTDFVVAYPADAKLIGDSSNPGKEFAGLGAKGVDQVKLGTLYAILIGMPYDTSFMTDEASLLYSVSDDGPWVQQVPHELVSILAKLTDYDIPKVAAEWIQTEEFDPMFSRWTPEMVQWFLQEIAVLSRKAVGEGKSLLMWMSL